MKISKGFLVVALSVLCSSVSLAQSESAGEEDVNVVELSYFEGAGSDVEGDEGVTEEMPGTTTEGYLPVHPKLKAADKFSVPEAKGTERQIGNLTVYESPIKSDSKILLITVYDIFGFHPHVKYISDKLAESGFVVVIPDFFHGDPVGLEDFPQPNFAQRAIHLFNKNGSWIDAKSDLLQVIQTYKKEKGVTAVGIFGFCWGGKIGVYATSDPDFPDIKALGLVHPSRVTTEDASDIKATAILLPSKDEPDMKPFLNILNNNLGNKSEHHRYEEMSHGFAGARSDFSDPKIRERVEDVIQRLSQYFTKTLKLSTCSAQMTCGSSRWTSEMNKIYIGMGILASGYIHLIINTY